MAPNDKLPPHNIEAEEAVLGSLLLLGVGSPDDYTLIRRVLSYLMPSDFFREKNAWIYQAMLDVIKSGSKIDKIIVAHRLNQQGNLDAIGGPAYFYHLDGAVATSYHIEYYANIVRDCANRRRQITEAGRMAAQAYNGEVKKQGKGLNL